MVERSASWGRVRSLSEGWNCWLNTLTALPAPPTAGNSPAATSAAAARMTNGMRISRNSIPAGLGPGGRAIHGLDG